MLEGGGLEGWYGWEVEVVGRKLKVKGGWEEGELVGWVVEGKVGVRDGLNRKKDVEVGGGEEVGRWGGGE